MYKIIVLVACSALFNSCANFSSGTRGVASENIPSAPSELNGVFQVRCDEAPVKSVIKSNFGIAEYNNKYVRISAEISSIPVDPNQKALLVIVDRGASPSELTDRASAVYLDYEGGKREVSNEYHRGYTSSGIFYNIESEAYLPYSELVNPDNGIVSLIRDRGIEVSVLGMKTSEQISVVDQNTLKYAYSFEGTRRYLDQGETGAYNTSWNGLTKGELAKIRSVTSKLKDQYQKDQKKGRYDVSGECLLVRQ